MVLIRMIVLKGSIENVRIFARHVKGVNNGFADSLSRNKLGQFHELCMKAGKVMDSTVNGYTVFVACGEDLED